MGTSTVPQNTAVLTSWKDIARYMGKGVRTVQRWELDFGLPVRRPQGSNKKAVLARPHDLDAWVALRCTSRSQQPPRAADRSVPQFSKLALLNAQIETSRKLREDNHELMAQVRSQLMELRRQVLELQNRERQYTADSHVRGRSFSSHCC
jgi:hypothetical protein